MSLQARYQYNDRTGIITDSQTGKEAGEVVNGVRVVHTEVGSMTAATLAWKLYHGDPSEDMKIVPIDFMLPLSIHNLKEVPNNDHSDGFVIPEFVHNSLLVDDADAEPSESVSDMAEESQEAEVKDVTPHFVLSPEMTIVESDEEEIMDSASDDGNTVVADVPAEDTSEEVVVSDESDSADDAAFETAVLDETSGKWRGQILVDGKITSVGLFQKKKAAVKQAERAQAEEDRRS